MNNKFFKVLFCVFVIAVISSCDHAHSVADTPKNGTINISVDESFKPVIDEEIAAYEASFPNANIIVHYKPEAECLKDIFNDSSTRLAIVTRGLSIDEEKYFNNSIGYTPRWDKVATDAIAIVVNNKSADSVFTFDQLRKLLTGQSGKKRSVVFDGLSATSTVRFAIDSILKGQKFDTSAVKAAKSSQDVLNYVAANPDAIGMVGISWIGNPEDTAQVAMLTKVKMAYVRCDECADSPYVKPTQLGIETRRYPLVRGLYYILKENYNGLGSGFVDFLQYERGQLIFRRAYLGPSKIGFQIRNVKINEKLDSD
ncbi:MAG TPA: substrate-binding domain-containing protein [Ferruginibacter sp.]|jgi:phosphate transport system substrate-binding protein|nr:substrate-binding domain-containing protein [Ferruginibacter sp.]